MIAVATVGLGINLIGMKLLGGHSHNSEDMSKSHLHQNNKKEAEEDLNIRGAYLEVFADTLGSVGVIIAGLIIFTTKFYLADPIISIY